MQLDLRQFEPASDEEKAQIETMRESTTFFRDGMRKLRRNRLAMTSLIVLILLTLLAAGGCLYNKVVSPNLDAI